MTPFGRQPVTAGLLATNALAEAPAPDQAPDKWALLRDLTVARAAFAVSDRDLAVLSALLSFHPGKELADDDRLIVFPSNVALSERAHGMAESTLRRHLAALVRAGLILRRDSPNGKRYAIRDAGGAPELAFGFDLRPLLVQAPAIAAAAAEARAAAAVLRRLREATVIHLRDAAKLIDWAQDELGGRWDGLCDRVAQAQRALRRKLAMDDLRHLMDEVHTLLADTKARIRQKTEKMDGNDRENGRHYQNSNPYPYESELCQERQKATGGPDGDASPMPPPIPLGLVLKAAPDIRDYAPDGIRSWRDLAAAANFIRPMLGVSPDAWRAACDAMGAENAAITLVCILQRSDQINSPGGYLRALTDKAETAGFSVGPMVMALLRVDNARPA